jgi:hypothetical protein
MVHVRSFGSVLRVFAGIAMMAVVVERAQAATLATSLVTRDVGCTTQCMITNVGKTGVLVNSVTAVDVNGMQVGVTGFCTFPGTIFPGLTCAESLDSNLTAAYCVIDVPGSTKNIRAALLTFCNDTVQRAEAR